MTVVTLAHRPMTATLPTLLSNGPFAIATQGLIKRFGGETALGGVDLQVPEGGVYVLVGPNGAGKSTVFRVLLDLVRADAGSAKVLGLCPRGDGPSVRAQIGYMPEGQDWGHGWMRVGELLEYHARYFPTWDRGYVARLARAFGIRLDRSFGSLSKGQARRVYLVMALAHRPTLLLLDEPTDGLDPVILDEILGILMEHIAQTPTTVLISTHQLLEVDRLAEYVGFLRDGKLVGQLSREDLQRKLRRYRAEVPDEWGGVPELNGTVLRKSSLNREIQWTIWGEEREVVECLALAGAELRGCTPLTLKDAAIAVLSRSERP